MAQHEATKIRAVRELGTWKSSTGDEFAFSVYEQDGGCPVVTIAGTEASLERVLVERDPTDVTADEWAKLGDRLKAADPKLLALVYAALNEASEHPERAMQCPALARARRSA